jgi:eukaryotic-like serine/threonine-protein kinase
MDSKIFLGKYRVAAEEIAAVGEPGDSPLAYEGEEIDSGKKVVVEVVPAGSLKAAARVQLEARALAARKLNHLNIPALYDFGVQNDDLVYITEDFDGTLAEEWVNANGPMPLGPVLRIAAQVVSALGAAAFHRIVHRAINPSNLVLVPGQTAEGQWPLVKVLHFVGGAAFDKSSDYTSPEQLQTGTVDFRSEIYSLGCTMWFLLTGAPPTTTGPDVENLGAVPKNVRRLLGQMLSANPDARPNDPLAFYQQLQDCLAEVAQREAPARPARVPALRNSAIMMPPRRRSPWRALTRTALCLAMAALTALILREYLQYRRVLHAEQPLGIPIGVTDAFASPTPSSEAEADTMVSVATSPPPAEAEADSTTSVPAKNAEADNTNALAPATDPADNASSSEVVAASAQPTPADSPAYPEAESPPPVTANNISTPPATINSSEPAATTQVELAPTPVRSRDSEVSAVVPSAAPKKIIMHEVRRAEPAEPDEPEVRRAEPSEEDPAKIKPATTATPGHQVNSATQEEQSRDAKLEAMETRARKAKQTDSQPTVLVKVPR